MDRDAELERLLAEDLEAAEAGAAPPPAVWVERHPGYRAELAEFFALRRDFEALAAPIRDAAPPPTMAHDRFPLSFGRYTLLAELGCGGMGVVYRARLDDPARVVALKMIRAGRFASAADRLRFRTEAEAATLPDHPGIVPVYDVGEAEGHPYYTMRLLAGGDLADRQPRLAASPAAAAGVVRDLASAIHHAHRSGVLHRDLKPSNVLFDDEGRAHVSDFGLAKLADRLADLTRTWQLLGTPAYMSPEQAAGKPTTVATDVYGLGCLLYFALTGRPPVGGTDTLPVTDRVRDEVPAPPRRANPLVPRDLEAICLTCLEKDSRRRYPSAAAVAADLDRFLNGTPVQARRAGPVERAARWARRRPELAGLIVSIAGFVAFAAVTAARDYRQVRAHNAELGSALTRELAALEGEREQARTARQALEQVREQERRAQAAREVERALHERVRLQRYGPVLAQACDHWAAGRTDAVREMLTGLEPGPGEADLREFAWHYLSRLAPDWLVLRGHRDRVRTVAASPDGRWIASGGADGAVVLWDLAAGGRRNELIRFPTEVVTVTFSPDNRKLAAQAKARPTGGTVIQVWDVPTGRPLARWTERTLPNIRMEFSSDGRSLSFGGLDSKLAYVLSIWDLEKGASRIALRVSPHPGYEIRGYCARPDLSSIAVAYEFPGRAVGRQRAVVQRADDRQPGVVFDPAALLTNVWGMRYSPDGAVLAAASADGSVHVWDADTGRERFHDRHVRGQAKDITFSPDGRRLAVVYYGPPRVVRWWDVASGRGGNDISLAAGGHALAFVDDQSVAVGLEDATVRVQPLRRPPAHHELTGHQAEVWSVAFDPAGRLLASGGDDHTVRLWDAAARTQRAELTGHTSLVMSVAWVPGGRELVSGGHDGTVRVWDAAAGAGRELRPAHAGPVTSVAVSPDGRRAASRGRDGVTRVWDLPARRLHRELPMTRGMTGVVAFSPDSRTLAVAAGGDGLLLWDAESGADAGAVRDPDYTWAVAYGPDGTLATGHADGSVWVRDARTLAVRATRFGHDGGVRSVAYSPDGRTLATGGDDGTVRLWHVPTGVHLLTLKGHSGKVYAVQFSPDGKTLASGSHDGTVRLWPSTDPGQ